VDRLIVVLGSKPLRDRRACRHRRRARRESAVGRWIVDIARRWCGGRTQRSEGRHRGARRSTGHRSRRRPEGDRALARDGAG
jgi:hypothetical protein